MARTLTQAKRRLRATRTLSQCRSRSPCRSARHLAGACTYLDDSRAEHRWSRIGKALEYIAPTPAMTAEIVESARAAFRALTAWYEAPVELRQAM